jgi:hypothetical protein
LKYFYGASDSRIAVLKAKTNSLWEIAMMRIVCLLPVILMLSGCNDTVQTPVKVALPEKKVDPTSIKTVRLIVNEDYGDAEKFEGLPVGDDMAKLLSIFGLNALRDLADLPPSFEYTDATMIVDVNGTPLGQNYFMGGLPPAFFSFNSAKVEIEVRMTAGRKTIAFFKGQKELKSPTATSNITKTPEDAPFGIAYPKEELLTKGFFILYRMLRRKDREPFAATLIDDDIFFRGAAFRALHRIDPNWIKDEELARKALPEFLAILRREARAQPGVIQYSKMLAIAPIGSSAMEELISLLADEDAAFRKVIIQVLGEMRDPRAIEPLIARLKDEHDSNYASDALSAITWQKLGRDPEKWLAWWQKNKESLLRGR